MKRKQNPSQSASHRSRFPAKIIFVTGTDTGVGKTILTGLLVHHLRSSGVHALAMKPFCSGGRADVRLLRAMQDGELAEDEINPFYFPEPIAPLISARQHKRAIPLAQVIQRIQEIAARCECLVIEGSGGLLVPLGMDFQNMLSHSNFSRWIKSAAHDQAITVTKNLPLPEGGGGVGGKGASTVREAYFVSDLIQHLQAEVIIVSRNRLGTINHTLMTLKVLRDLGVNNIQIALVDQGRKDLSSTSNHRTPERVMCSDLAVVGVSFLSKNARKSDGLKNSSRKMKKTLARFFR